MALNVIGLANQIVANPIEVIDFISPGFDSIRSVAKHNKKGKYLLKTIKPNPPAVKEIYVHGKGQFFIFEAERHQQGYIVGNPQGYDEFPKPEILLSLNVSRDKQYKAYTKPNLPEHCMIRLQEIEIEAMQKIMADSTPEQLESMFELGKEDDDEAEKAADAIDKIKASEGQEGTPEGEDAEVDTDAVLLGLELLKDNFELAKFTLSQTSSKRKTVEAYFNMDVGLLEEMPTTIVDVLDVALNAAFARVQEEGEAELLLEDTEDETDEGK